MPERLLGEPGLQDFLLRESSSLLEEGGGRLGVQPSKFNLCLKAMV